MKVSRKRMIEVEGLVEGQLQELEGKNLVLDQFDYKGFIDTRVPYNLISISFDDCYTLFCLFNNESESFYIGKNSTYTDDGLYTGCRRLANTSS
ncbi:MAG: hypothetical protein ACXQTI_04175 [Candidatus Nezhaarchaeales archaeon]